VLGSRRIDGQTREVAGERTGVRESIGRRQNPATLPVKVPGFSFLGSTGRLACWQTLPAVAHFFALPHDDKTGVIDTPAAADADPGHTAPDDAAVTVVRKILLH
jgi:hypothetical protein